MILRFVFLYVAKQRTKFRVPREMGRIFLRLLEIGCDRDQEYDETCEENDDLDSEGDFEESIFVCRGCVAHLTRGSELVSKDFRGRSGKAYLFNEVTNTFCGAPEDRMLITGLHTIADVFCINCSKSLGWKYVHAFEERQRYKVGKVILEAAYIRRLHDGRPRLPTRSLSCGSKSSSDSA